MNNDNSSLSWQVKFSIFLRNGCTIKMSYGEFVTFYHRVLSGDIDYYTKIGGKKIKVKANTTKNFNIGLKVSDYNFSKNEIIIDINDYSSHKIWDFIGSLRDSIGVIESSGCYTIYNAIERLRLVKILDFIGDPYNHCFDEDINSWVKTKYNCCLLFKMNLFMSSEEFIKHVFCPANMNWFLMNECIAGLDNFDKSKSLSDERRMYLSKKIFSTYFDPSEYDKMYIGDMIKKRHGLCIGWRKVGAENICY